MGAVPPRQLGPGIGPASSVLALCDHDRSGDRRVGDHSPLWGQPGYRDPLVAEGYILEVACLRGDGPGGGQFFSQVFKILDDSVDAGAFWNSEDAPGGAARWITSIDEFADALDECPVPGIDRNSLTPRVRKLLLDEQRLLLEPEAETS